MIRRPAFKDEPAIAIAAVDEADLVVDLVIDPGMAERRVDLAGAVLSSGQTLRDIGP